MPIDRSLLEPVRPGFDPELLEWARGVSQQNAEKDRHRRTAIRDAYVRDLISPFAPVRMQGQRRARKELTDPIDRRNLVEDVAMYGRALESLDRQERSEAGYVGRAAIDLRKSARTAGGAVARSGRSFARLVPSAIGMGLSGEDVKFERALEAKRYGEEPAKSLIDTPGALGSIARGAEITKESVATLAPDMIPGIAALKAGGRGASAAFWASRQFADSYEDLKEMGVSDAKARVIGATIAGGTGLLEQFVPDVTGFVKGKGIVSQVARAASRKATQVVGAGLKRPLAKKAVSRATGVTVRAIGETAEEGAQAAYDEAIKFNVAARDPEIEYRDVADIGRRAWEAMVEAGPGIAAMGGGGGAVQFSGDVARFKRKSAGLKQSKMETEIMRFAQSGETPSRTQWAKWGGLAEEGFSMKNRKAGVKSIAQNLGQIARVRTVVEGRTPTEQQWKDWGFDPGKGKTPEARKAFLFEKFRKGYVSEQREKAESRLGELQEVANDTVVKAKQARLEYNQDLADFQEAQPARPEGNLPAGEIERRPPEALVQKQVRMEELDRAASEAVAQAKQIEADYADFQETQPGRPEDDALLPDAAAVRRRELETAAELDEDFEAWKAATQPSVAVEEQKGPDMSARVPKAVSRPPAAVRAPRGETISDAAPEAVSRPPAADLGDLESKEPVPYDDRQSAASHPLRTQVWNAIKSLKEGTFPGRLTGTGDGRKGARTGREENDRKSLQRLRKALPNVPREDFNAAVLEMERRGEIVLVPFERFDIHEDDKAAEIQGRQDKQAIAVKSEPTAEALESQESRSDWKAKQREAKEKTEKKAFDKEMAENRRLREEAEDEVSDDDLLALDAPQMDTDEVDITDSVKKTDSAIGNFIQDSAGRIGIDIEKAGRGLKKAKGIGARFALSRGELPQEIFEAKTKKEGLESKIQTQIRFAVKKFRKLEKEVFGKDGMNGRDMAIIKIALQGSEPAMNSLDPRIRPVISEIRRQVDALSAHLRSIGAVAGDLAVIVEGNEGTYLTTTYRAFQGPKWTQDVPQEIKNTYADFIRKEFPDKTNEEIDGMIGKILYDAEQSGSPMAMAKEARLGAKDVSILTRKKDLPDELKALLGEEEDPILNYALSVTKLGNLIANHQFQVDIRDVNGGEYFSKNAIAGTDKGDMVAEIELANETFYTTPELKAAMDREYQRDTLPAWLRHYMKANAAVKISKTLGSSQAQVRNIKANVLLSVANGHWRLGMIKPAWKATWANFIGKGNKQTQNLIESAVEYQVVGQDVRAGELADLVHDAGKSADIESHMYFYEARRASIVKKALRGGLRVTARAYQAGDDFFKLYAWLNERVRYKKAYPTATSAEIKQKAANVVRDTFPNYSLIPEGVKQIRKLPIIGSFVSFRSEMIRTSYKMLVLTYKEIANPKTRKIGYARLAGMSAAAYAIPSLANALRLFYKVSKEDEEDLRNFLPDYQINSTLAHTTGNVDGEFGVIDLTYVDPHGSFRQMYKAAMAGEDLGDAVLGALGELLEPFISDEILFAKLIDVRRNRKKGGGEIYNEEDNLDKITGDIVAHIWDAFEPGTVTSVERGVKGLTGYVSEHGQTYNAAVEAGAAFLGARVSNRSIRDSFPYVLGKLVKRKTKAEGILNDVITRGGKVSDSEITEAYDSSTSARKAIFAEMSKVSGAASRLLKSPSEVSRMLTASSISVRDRQSILSEVYFKRIYSDAFWSKTKIANPQEYLKRRTLLLRLSRGNLEENSKKK